MISVSTGRQRIQDIDEQYKRKFIQTDKTLQRLNFNNPNPFKDLGVLWKVEFDIFKI